jgi:hypothetical protein
VVDPASSGISRSHNLTFSRAHSKQFLKNACPDSLNYRTPVLITAILVVVLE